MKKVTLSLDSSLKEIFTYEESRAAFDKFLPGMRTMAEKQPAALGFSVRKILQFSGGAIPAEAADALDAALCALELYSAEPEMSDTPLTPDGAEVVPEPPRDAIYPGKVWRDTNGRRIQAHGGALYYEDGVYYWYGENKDHTDGKCPVWTWGMRAYRSTDLCNWEDLGLFIQPDLTDKDARCIPRPALTARTLSNARTRASMSVGSSTAVPMPALRSCRPTNSWVPMKLSNPTTARLAVRSVTLTLPFAAIRRTFIWTQTTTVS